MEYQKITNFLNSEVPLNASNQPSKFRRRNWELEMLEMLAGQADNNGKIDNVEIMVPLKYLSNFWRTLEMPLINCEVELILTWSANCVIIYTDVANQNPTFTITETNLYVPEVTLSTQDNVNYYHHRN